MQKYALCAWFCALFLLVPVQTLAETHVSSADHGGPIWNEAGSPYIVDDSITIEPGEALTIEPGTVVTAGSAPGAGALYFEGDSTIEGTPEKPVTFENLPGIIMDSGVFLIQNTAFENAPLGIYNATATLDHISSTGADTAILARKSTVSASDVSISSSTEGIDSVYARPVLVGFNSALRRLVAFFAPARAFAQVADDPGQNHITIHDSSFLDTQYAVYNDTTNTIHAENNWWGSDAGPGTTSDATTSMIHGPVSYIPWTGQATSTPRVTCCSSVLFVPGIEASRLAVLNRRIFGTSTSQLWEPITNGQVQNLYLNDQGISIQQNIKATGIIDSALDLMPLYQKFIGTMNGLVAAGTIAQWQPYPYDWRLPLTTVAQGVIGTSTVVQAIESMASSSKTGKVTIIAHSNGGLVTKLLYDQLRDKGEAGLVDKVIFVAVPEIGTPQALPSLLHGDGEEIADGLILSASTARGLGVNMPSAYSLLPDQSYFSSVSQAVISFASSTLAGFNFAKYFPAVSSYAKMKSFVDDASHGSLSDPTNVPAQGNAGLFPQAESVHSIIDAWRPASSTQLVAIAGWGLPTDAGITYYQKIVCALTSLLQKKCAYELQFEDANNSGDGTVILPSASYSSSTKQLFDIASYDRNTDQKLAHADILQADPVETAIQQDLGVGSSSTGIPYITSAIPTDYKFPDDLVIDVHSPADVNIYDKDGNHTGPIPNPIPGSDLDAYENNIPASFYKETGDGVEVTLPFSPDYTIDLDGTGMGGVTVDTRIENYGTHAEISLSSFEGMIVTPVTHMEFAASTSTDERSSYQVIKIDEDGDGVFDATATPGVEPDITPASYENSVSACIRALHLAPADEKDLLGRLDKAWKFAQNDRSGKANKAFMDLMDKRVHHIRIGRVTDQNRAEMHGMIEGWLDDMGV